MGALKYRSSIFQTLASTDHSQTQEQHRNPADKYFVQPATAATAAAAAGNESHIQDYSNHFERGAAPYIKPDFRDTDNPRNLQPSVQACKQQCETIPDCHYGTYIVSGARTQECWLAAQTGSVDVRCGMGCRSFDKVSFRSTENALLALLDRSSPSGTTIALGIAVAVSTIGFVVHQFRTQYPADRTYTLDEVIALV